MNVYGALIIAFVLFFPIRLDVCAYIDFYSKKIWFGVYPFGLIRVFGGYICIRGGGVNICTRKDKIKIMKFGDAMKLPYDFKIFKGVEAKSIALSAVIGGDNEVSSFVGANIYTVVSSVIMNVLSMKGIKFRNEVIISDDKRDICLNGRIKLYFNVAVLIAAAVKKIVEVVLNSCQKLTKSTR